MKSTSTQQDFEQMIRSFEAIAAIRSQLRREYELIRIAAYHGIPKANFRRLFRLYLIERIEGGSDE